MTFIAAERTPAVWQPDQAEAAISSAAQVERFKTAGDAATGGSFPLPDCNL